MAWFSVYNIAFKLPWIFIFIIMILFEITKQIYCQTCMCVVASSTITSFVDAFSVDICLSIIVPFVLLSFLADLKTFKFQIIFFLQFYDDDEPE